MSGRQLVALFAAKGTMSESPEESIVREVEPNEKVLWAGRPLQGLLFRSADIFLIPFSLLWGGFAVFWEFTVLSMPQAPWFFALWGIPFVLMGAYITVGRFWVDTRQRENTVYAVTAERIIIRSGLFSKRVKSLSIDTVTDISLNERANGSGTITFGPTMPFNLMWFQGAAWPGFGNQSVPNFELASDARKVYEIIRDAQRSAKQKG